MASFLNPFTTPLLLTGVFLLGLAVAVWAMDLRNVRHRVFALFLLVSAGTSLIPVFRFAADPADQLYFTGLNPYFFLASFPLALLFVSYYPHARGIGRWRHAPLAVGLLTFSLFLWYLLDHSAYGVVGPVPEGGVQNAGPGRAFVEYGPLFLIAGLRFIVGGLIGLIVARDYARAPAGSAGFSRFLVCAGFTLNGMFVGMNGLTDIINAVIQQPAFPWLPYGWVQYVMPTLNIPLAIGAMVYIHKASKHEANESTLQEPRRFLLYVMPVAIVSGLLLSYDPFIEVIGHEALIWAFGLWKLVIPILITYALLRFQVFGADIRIKHSVAKSILVVIFTGIFLVVLEAAEALLGEGFGFWTNLAIAAFLALIAAPLQKLAERAADRVMPDTKSVVEQDPYERGEFYMSQYELVHEDGGVSRKDRAMLDRLALSLRISNKQQKELEAGTNNLPHIKGYAHNLRAELEPPKSKWTRALTVLLTAALFGAVGQGLESLIPVDSFGYGLISAAFITLAIGPIEAFSGRLLEPADDRKARQHRLSTYRNAVKAAFVDGNITAKERLYLDRLQKELGLTQVERIQIHLRTARRLGA